MKNKLNPSLIVNVLIGVVVILLVSLWASSFVWRGNLSSVEIDTAYSYTGHTKIHEDLKPIDDIVPDSISYLQHKRLTDSIAALRTLRNGDGFLQSSSVEFASIGTFCSFYCDTCNVKFSPNSDPAFSAYGIPMQNYIVLLNWKIGQLSDVYLANHLSQFYVDNKGQSYLRKLVKDTAWYKSIYGLSRQHAVDIPVPFRYNKSKNCLMIPVTATTKNTVQYVLVALLIISIIYFLFFIIGGFIKFIIDVSRGQTFTQSNVLRLKIISLSLIAYPVFMFLMNFVVELIFSRYFTKDVTLSSSSWSNSWISLFAGLIFLLLYKAFRDGKRIKEEQDLVI